MKKTFKHIVLLALMIMFSAVANAIEQDSEGYYLIGSVADWRAFSEIVQTNNSANARMTADVNLGDDQSKMSDTSEFNPTYCFEGIFDGQGHTLTVNYKPDPVNTGANCSPFPNIRNATIKNVHITGTIVNATTCQPSIVGKVRQGTSYLEQVWSSVHITSTKPDWDEAAAFVGCVDPSTSLFMTDCMFDGVVDANTLYNGCFVGYIAGGGTAKIKNCLSIGTFNLGYGAGIRGEHTNCYIKQFPTEIPAEMQCTDSQIANRTILNRLQAGRAETVWMQSYYPNQPILAQFAKPQLYRSYTIGTGGYSTFGLSFLNGGSYYSAIVSDNAEIFTAKVEDNKLKLIKRDDHTLPAGAAVLLKANEGETVNIWVDARPTPTAMGQNALRKGHNAFVSSNENIFALATIDGKTAFYRVNTGVTIPEDKAYLDLTNVAGAKELTMLECDDDATTDIDAVNTVEPQQNDAIYNLAGQRVDDDYKGIVIKEGKKILRR